VGFSEVFPIPSCVSFVALNKIKRFYVVPFVKVALYKTFDINCEMKHAMWLVMFTWCIVRLFSTTASVAWVDLVIYS